MASFGYVSVDELIQYYKDNGITDYPKKKDGTPNMTRIINKDAVKTILKLKINSSVKRKAEMKSDISEEVCPICSDPFEDICFLKCRHKFCVNCAISHFRVKHNCPLCRQEICSIPKTTTPICDEYVEAIADNVLNNENIRRNMLSMKGYILDKLVFYKRNNVLNVESYVTEIQNEFMNSIFDISDSITDWYVS